MTQRPVFLERGSGDPPLVFLHGAGGGARGWEPQLASLSRTFRCVAWNAPGYCGTPLPPVLDWPTLSLSVLALMIHLELDRAVLVGHAMGGMVAQDFVARYPGRVCGLVLSGTGPRFGSRDGGDPRDFVSTRLEPLRKGGSMRALAEDIVPTLTARPADPAVIELAVSLMAEVPEATYRAAVHNLVTFDGREHLGRIGVPTLVLAGAADRHTPADVMERMAGRIEGSRFECISGAGHLAHMERPASYDDCLVRFVAEL